VVGGHPGFTLAQLIENTADELRKLRKTPPEQAVIQPESGVKNNHFRP